MLTRRALTAIGTSAGGRQMKAIIAIAPDGSIHSGQTSASPEYKHCLIKFNTPEHALSETEMTYYQMACQCGITIMDSRLIEVDGVRHRCKWPRRKVCNHSEESAISNHP